MPLVSVLMSVYNGAGFLCEAVESILGQTFQDFEFLIINDASTDNSRDIILSYNDPRIRLLDNPERMGLTRSLNRGLREAQGALIARMDADDVSMPGRLAAQADAMDQSAADVCFCRVVYVDETSGEEWVWAEAGWDLTRWWGLFRNIYGQHPAAMFKRDAILAIGGYDERFVHTQDYDLWDRCVAHGLEFVYIPEPLLHYRLRAQGISRQHLVDQERYARQVSFRAIRRLLPNASADELLGLCWLFLQRETDVADEPVRAGLHRCWELITAFLPTCESGQGQVIWNDVAVCLASRLGVMDNRSRLIALGLIVRAVKNSQSVWCLARTVRAFAVGVGVEA